MIVFDQAKLNELFSRLSSGFGVDPRYVGIFIAAMVGIVSFLLVSYRIIRRGEERRIAATIEERNDRAFSRYSFSAAERALIDVLAEHLNDPRRKYLLLTDPHAFSIALQRARARNPIDRAAAGSLQRRLGIDPRKHITRLRSTADLPEGLPVVLERSKQARIPGVVARNSAEALVVELRRAPGSVVRGGTITLYCHDPRGVFAFSTQIRRLQGTHIALSHSSKLKHAQRRAYFRRNVSMRVVVRVEGREGTSHTTRLVDLSGGGASLVNAGGFLRQGDEISLFLTRGKDDWLPIPGNVVRLSDEEDIAHVRFGEMTEVVRDHIVRIVQAG